MNDHTEPSLTFVTLDVFTEALHKGNPLAICQVPPLAHISDDTLQKIAREFNFSETVFLYEAPAHDRKQPWVFRIFTTEMELPFAGHPTIGTACYILSRQNLESASLLCHAGEVEVELRGRRAYARIPSSFHLHKSSPNTDQIMELQPGLRTCREVIGPIDLVSPVKGMTFVVVQLASLEALAVISTTGLNPVVTRDTAWDTGFVGTAYYVADGGRDGTSRYRTRMIETTMEDPATGSMSCALACLLATRSQCAEAQFEFVQGVEMGRESHIGVDLTLHEGKVESVTLHGSAVTAMSGSVRY